MSPVTTISLPRLDIGSGLCVVGEVDVCGPETSLGIGFLTAKLNLKII